MITTKHVYDIIDPSKKRGKLLGIFNKEWLVNRKTDLKLIEAISYST